MEVTGSRAVILEIKVRKEEQKSGCFTFYAKVQRVLLTAGDLLPPAAEAGAIYSFLHLQLEGALWVGDFQSRNWEGTVAQW